LDVKGSQEDSYVFNELNKTASERKTWLLWGLIGFGVLALVFACCVVLGWKSLKLAIDVIDASADFLYKTKRVVLVPILYFVVTLIVVFVWLGMLVCVASMNKIEPHKTIPQAKKITATSDFNYWALWYMLFGLLWLVSFIQYKTQFIVQVSAASYYFDSSATKDGSADVGAGFKFAYLNHMGSLALGSFIIAVIRLAKIAFVYAARQAAKASGEN